MSLCLRLCGPNGISGARRFSAFDTGLSQESSRKTFEQMKHKVLHAFCDASQKAYGAVAFIVTKMNLEK